MGFRNKYEPVIIFRPLPTPTRSLVGEALAKEKEALASPATVPPVEPERPVEVIKEEEAEEEIVAAEEPLQPAPPQPEVEEVEVEVKNKKEDKEKPKAPKSSPKAPKKKPSSKEKN